MPTKEKKKRSKVEEGLVTTGKVLGGVAAAAASALTIKKAYETFQPRALNIADMRAQVEERDLQNQLSDAAYYREAYMNSVTALAKGAGVVTAGVGAFKGGEYVYDKTRSASQKQKKLNTETVETFMNSTTEAVNDFAESAEKIKDLPGAVMKYQNPFGGLPYDSQTMKLTEGVTFDTITANLRGTDDMLLRYTNFDRDIDTAGRWILPEQYGGAGGLFSSSGKTQYDWGAGASQLYGATESFVSGIQNLGTAIRGAQPAATTVYGMGSGLYNLFTQ